MGFRINSKIQFDKQEFLDFLTTKFNEYKTYWDVLNGLPDVVTEEWIEKTCKRLGINIDVFYNSLMSLGGGNHFLEYGETESGLAGFSIHCGSRNLGQKICNYWTKKTKKNVVDIKEFKNEYLKKCKVEEITEPMAEGSHDYEYGTTYAYINGRYYWDNDHKNDTFYFLIRKNKQND